MGDLFTFAVGLGVVQAIIGMLKKFGVKGNMLLVWSMPIAIALTVAVYYLGAYPLFQQVMQTVMLVLSAGGWWRFRNGELPSLSPDDPDMTNA
jgi:membrane protein implicated in regulation of membrane protease activity